MQLYSLNLPEQYDRYFLERWAAVGDGAGKPHATKCTEFNEISE